MRIAIVTNTSWNIYNFRMGLVKLLKEKGHEVIAVAPHDEYSEAISQEIPWHEVRMKQKGSNPLADLAVICSFYRIYKKTKPDAILHFTIKPNIYGAIAAAWAGIPCINTVSGLGTVFLHKGLVPYIASKLYRFSFRFPEVVIFQNEDDRDLFVSRKLVKADKTRLFPGSGVNLKKFSPESASLTSDGEFSFLLVARLLKDKGIAEYAAAAKIIKTKYRNVKFLLAGAPEDDRILGIASEDIRLWENEGYICYLGFQKNIPELLNRAGCVVLPSYREGTPKSLLEAAAMAKPLLASDVAGCREVVKDGENGFLFEVKNAADMAARMETILNMPAEQLAVLGRNSRKLVEERFSEEIVTHKYLELLEKIVRN